MTTPSTWFTPQQCVDIVRFYETRMTRDLFSFIPNHVKEQKAKTTFLDVGPGAGILTKQLAPTFNQVDVIEPNRVNAENLKQYNVCHNTLQGANIGADQYDLILCCHVFYHIPVHEWDKCLLKAYDGLKPGGRLVLTVSSPTRGAYKDLQESVCPKGGGEEQEENTVAAALLRTIQELKLPFRKEGTQARITADEFDMFHDMVRMFAWSWNKTELEDCSDAERSRVELAMENFAKKCFDPTTGAYILIQEEDTIVVQKPSIKGEDDFFIEKIEHLSKNLKSL